MNQVPTQGSAETVSLRSNSKMTLLAIHEDHRFRHGATWYTIFRSSLIWWAWPSKVGVVEEISHALMRA